MRRIAIPEFVELKQRNTAFTGELSAIIEENKSQIDSLTMLDSFQGEFASGSKSYFSEVHGALLSSITLIVESYEQLTVDITEQFRALVLPGDDIVVTVEHLDELEAELNRFTLQFEEIDVAISNEINSIASEVPISHRSNGDIQHQMSQQGIEFQTLQEKISHFEQSSSNLSQPVLQNIESANALIKETGNIVSRSGINYTSGMYNTNPIFGILLTSGGGSGNGINPFVGEANKIMYDQLINVYGFTEEEAKMLTNLYHKICTNPEVEDFIPSYPSWWNLFDGDRYDVYADVPYSKEALFFNIIASFVYCDDYSSGTSFMWHHDVGVFDFYEQEKLLETLGYEFGDKLKLREMVREQHKGKDVEYDEDGMPIYDLTSDFAHFSATIFAELNPKNVRYIDDNRAGWAGDLGAIDGHHLKVEVFPDNFNGVAKASMNNRDYKSDLDALSISTRMGKNGTTYWQESKNYYDDIIRYTDRGTEFLVNLGIEEYGDQGNKNKNKENGLKKFDEVYDNIDESNKNERVYDSFRESLIRGSNSYLS